MKKSILAAVLLFFLFASCKKEAIPVQLSDLNGHWAMESGIITGNKHNDSFFGPAFSLEVYQDVFAVYQLVFTDTRAILQNPQQAEDFMELGTYSLADEGFTLVIQSSADESFGSYRLESIGNNRFWATDESGVRLEFVKTK